MFRRFFVTKRDAVWIKRQIYLKHGKHVIMWPPIHNVPVPSFIKVEEPIPGVLIPVVYRILSTPEELGGCITMYENSLRSDV